MITNNIIAIDGPTGSGKSTVSKRLAKKLNLLYIDTGAIYRGITYKVLQEQIDLSDEMAVKNLLDKTVFSYCEGQLCMDNHFLGNEIRTPEIDLLVSSKVSVHSTIRSYLTEQQIALGKAHPSVMDGRDIGTVLFPDAILKIYLTADLGARAYRRFEENRRKGIEQESLETIKDQVSKRDFNDSTRSIAPLKKAEDAIEIDSSTLTIDEVVERIENLYWERIKK